MGEINTFHPLHIPTLYLGHVYLNEPHRFAPQLSRSRSHFKVKCHFTEKFMLQICYHSGHSCFTKTSCQILSSKVKVTGVMATIWALCYVTTSCCLMFCNMPWQIFVSSNLSTWSVYTQVFENSPWPLVTFVWIWMHYKCYIIISCALCFIFSAGWHHRRQM